MAKVLNCGGSSASTYGAGGSGFVPLGNGPFTTALSFTEAKAQLTYRTAGVLSKLGCRVSAYSLNANAVVSSRINGAAGNQSISISGTGYFDDTSNTDTVSAGDEACIKFDTTAAGSGSFHLRTAYSLFSATTNTAQRLTCSGNVAQNTTFTTTYMPVQGLWDSANTTEANAQQYFGVAGSMKNLYAYVSANSRSDTSVFISRKNNADGNLTVSITTTSTGVFEDTSNTDTIASTDLYCWKLVGPVSGTGTIETTELSGEFVTTNDGGVICIGKAGSGYSCNARPRYTTLAGSPGTLESTESNVYIKAVNSFTASFLSVYLSGNSLNSTITFGLRAAATSTSLVVSVASGTGRFTDASNTPSVALNDDLTMEYSGAFTSGTCAIRTISMSATYPSISPGGQNSNFLALL